MGARPLQLGLCRLNVEAVWLLVQGGEDLPSLHRIALVDFYLPDAARDLETQAGGVDGFDNPGEPADLAGGDLGDGEASDRPHLLRDGGRLPLAPGKKATDDEPQKHPYRSWPHQTSLGDAPPKSIRRLTSYSDAKTAMASELMISMKMPQVSGTMTKALCARPYWVATAVMIAIVVAVEPRAIPAKPADMTAAS